MTGIFIHRPVLVREVVEALKIQPDGSYIDGTVGAGGHASQILESLGDGGRLLGIDRDREILEIASTRLESYGKHRFFLLHGSYENLEQICKSAGVERVEGILLDLGVSSLQLDHAERGFSFLKDAPLDMRMNPEEGRSAQEVLAQTSQKELGKIFRNLGEEPFSGRIARVIAETRRQHPLRTTKDLSDLILQAIPRRFSSGYQRLHPATRVFQALRIFVNRELERLEIFLNKVPDFLSEGGRLVILSYHSLEDRLVKTYFVDWERKGVLKRVTKKPMVASEEEKEKNPRSRSVKMRVAERMA